MPMNASSLLSSWQRRTLLVAGLLFFPLSLVSGAQAAAADTADAPATGSGDDRALESFQVELLELAFQTASAMPLDPHIKNRSRAQEGVVGACLELDQPELAAQYAGEIANWRRGAALADVAFYLVEKGRTEEALTFLKTAREIADQLLVEDEDEQPWRRDLIRAKAAKSYLLLGRLREAGGLLENMIQAQAGEAVAVQAELMDDAATDRYLEALPEVFKTGDFDGVRNALTACVELFDRYYEDAERREQMERYVGEYGRRLPPALCFDLYSDLAEAAVRHQDPARARELIHEAARIVAGANWSPEVQIPLLSRLAVLHDLAGEPDEARIQADAAMAKYAELRDRTVNIYRADALLPLAEAYQALGVPAAAQEIYRRAVEESVENPNSRPRAEDLTAICCSMAVHGVEPEAALWARIREIHGQLGDPW
jgi:tetratricopeptide (TPR) repeat protein